MDIHVNSQLKRYVLIQLVRLAQHYGDYGDGIGILFNKGRQVLHYANKRSSWEVFGTCDQNSIESCELILCDREKLSIGDTAFCVNSELIISKDCFSFLQVLSHFCKIISNTEHTHLTSDGKGISVSNSAEWKYWYKVICNE